MKDRDLDAMLNKLKNDIPVNEVLKQKMRKSFTISKKSSIMKKIIAAAAVAAVICIALLLPEVNNQKASAASLKVYNHISFLNIGGGGNIGVSEYKGTIYTPVSGKGLFAYDKSGFHKIYDKEVNFTRVSQDGKELVISAGGTISILDIQSGSIKEILKGDESAGVYFEEPSWSPDSKKIIYVKRVIEFRETHGFDVKESGIYEINLDTLISNKLGDGSYPSYIKDSNSILYENQGKIVIKDLKENIEKTVDSGRFPSATPDGSLIAYVKEETTSKEISENVEVTESLADIWIADILDTNIKKKITTNYAYHFINEDEWLKTLEPSEIPQALSYSGFFYYFDPVWSSDSQSLFALKNSSSTDEAPGSMNIIRIDLAQEKHSSADTVKKFMQALITRDEDYAASLVKTPIESSLTSSDSYQVGYKILSLGKENGKDYVDAEVYLQNNANPHYQIVKSRYYLSPSDDGYVIENIVENSKLEVYESEGTVFIGDGDKTVLLKESDIPVDYMPKDIPHRFSSLVYSERSHTLLMNIQYMNENGESTSISLLSYNVKSKKFNLIDELEAVEGSIGASNLSVDVDSQYLAVDLFTQGDKGSTTVVYNLQNKDQIILDSLMQDTGIDSVKSSFWCEDGLIFDVTGSEQTMSYLFNPDKTPQVQTIGK